MTIYIHPWSFHWIILRMRNVSYRSCGKKQNTRFVFSSVFPNHDVYEITWKNVVTAGQATVASACVLHAG